MDEKIISIIRNGTQSHRLLLFDHVLGHSEFILVLIQYSCKIAVNVILPSGSRAWITNSTLAPHALAVYKQSFWQVVCFRWRMDRWVLTMEMNWPQHKWRIHLHWSGLLTTTRTTCCAWQVHRQFWFHIHCLWCVWSCSWQSVILRHVHKATESDCWLCVCSPRGLSRLLLEGFCEILYWGGY